MTERTDAPENDGGSFARALPSDALRPGRIAVATVGGKKIALGLAGGEPFACLDECPHAGSSFAEGRVIGDRLICPFHGARFDVANGLCVNAPYSPLSLFKSRIVDGFVEVAIDGE